jgi:hypothetical protein
MLVKSDKKLCIMMYTLLNSSVYMQWGREPCSLNPNENKTKENQSHGGSETWSWGLGASEEVVEKLLSSVHIGEEISNLKF